MRNSITRQSCPRAAEPIFRYLTSLIPVFLVISALCITVFPALAAQPRKPEYLKPRPLPAYPQTYSSHIAAAASILDYLKCREKDESKTEFAAKTALFARKCLCDKPGKPYAYPLYDGLGAFNEAYGCKLKLRECYRKNPSRSITFGELKQELKNGNLAVITLLTGPAAGPDAERRHGYSYAVSGYRHDKKGEYLLTEIGGRRKEYAFKADCREMIVLIIGREK